MTGTRKIFFGCGRTQVQTSLKAKESIMVEFEINAPASRKHSFGGTSMWTMLSELQIRFFDC